MSNETTQKRSLSVSLGAAFLMATSAIGPGFLTQTSQFTAKYLSSFAFVIVCVIIMDMIAQTNVWSIVGVSGLRGQEIANKVLPGLGYLLVVLVVLGGLAFNIGNVGGVSLGFNAMIGIPEKAGVIIGGVLAICIFLSKKANDIVGRVNRKLKEIGKYNNTIVMFAADNGCAGYINMDRINRKGHYPSYIYRGYKSHGWEGGHRIPFILSWGDRYGHVTDNSLVSLTDLYATFADMLGYRIADDEAEDSFSFWPILDGSGNAARTDLIATSGAGYFTYRTPQYKLIFNAGNGSGEEYRIDGQPPLQFYDMVNDPEEKVNQINNPEYAGRIREMAARVKKYIEDGRSTPGAKAANDGGNSWKQITDIMSGLYAGNR